MLTKLKNLFCRPIPLPDHLDKTLHARVPRFLSIILIILFGFPLFLVVVSILVAGVLALYLLFFDHLTFGYGVDWIGFSLLLGVTLLALLVHHVFSKTKSVARLLRWSITLIFIEVVSYIWLNAWNWEYYLTDLSLDDSVVGYAQPIEDRLEIIMTYTKALFKTLTITCLAFIPWLYLRHNDKHNS